MTWLVLALVALAPVAMMWALFNVAAIVDFFAAGWRRLRPRRSAHVSSSLPVQQIAADLRRLNAYLDEVERSDAPARAARLRAAVLAYDDVLLIACRTLEIPAPERAPLEPVTRLETEAALAQHGLVW